MSFTGEFQAIAARYGQEVVLLSDGEELGRGLAVLRPLLDREKQFLPTELGVWRREQVLCLGQASLPFGSRPGGVVLQAGEEAYDVVNADSPAPGHDGFFGSGGDPGRHRLAHGAPGGPEGACGGGPGERGGGRRGGVPELSGAGL